MWLRLLSYPERLGPRWKYSLVSGSLTITERVPVSRRMVSTRNRRSEEWKITPSVSPFPPKPRKYRNPYKTQWLLVEIRWTVKHERYPRVLWQTEWDSTPSPPRPRNIIFIFIGFRTQHRNTYTDLVKDNTMSETRQSLSLINTRLCMQTTNNPLNGTLWRRRKEEKNWYLWTVMSFILWKVMD